MSRHKNKNENDIAYGIHSVESLLNHSPDKVLQIWLQKNRDDSRINTIIALAKKSGISVEYISTDKLNKKYEDVRHQGVVARIRESNKSIQIEDILDLEQCLLLVLDGVSIFLQNNKQSTLLFSSVLIFKPLHKVVPCLV